jgi:hypothetical protein
MARYALERWVSRRVQLPIDNTQLGARGVVAGFAKAGEFFQPVHALL